MCNKTRIRKTNSRKQKKVSHYCRRNSTAAFRKLYTVILFCYFILVGIALFLRPEATGVWTFLLGIGIPLTNILGRSLK